MKKLITLIALCAASLRAAEPRLLIVTDSGIIFVPLPPGVSLVTENGKPALKIAPPAAPAPIDEWQQLSADQASFALECASPSQLHVWRNGLKMAVNFDFDMSGSTLTFRAGAAPVAGDTVEFEYFCSSVGK
jgi:hypothetical protein